MLENYPDLLVIDEACEALHMSRNCMYQLLRSGDLKGFQQGRIWKIPKNAIEEYIRRRSGIL